MDEQVQAEADRQQVGPVKPMPPHCPKFVWHAASVELVLEDVLVVVIGSREVLDRLLVVVIGNEVVLVVGTTVAGRHCAKY